MYNHRDLVFQWEWAGARLQNRRILVCTQTCLDIPQEQLRAKILSADPLPIYNARPEPFTNTGFSYQEANIMCMPSFAAGGDFNADENKDFSQGGPLGLDGDGAEMAMPDGLTVMLHPTFGDGIGKFLKGNRGDFNIDYDTDYSGGI